MVARSKWDEDIAGPVGRALSLAKGALRFGHAAGLAASSPCGRRTSRVKVSRYFANRIWRGSAGRWVSHNRYG
jgi:hypothetical protein